MKEYEITLNGHTFIVRLLSDPRQEQVEVEVDGEAFTVEVKVATVEEELPAVPLPPPAEGAQPSAIARQPLGRAAPSGKAVTAPLPGVIKSIAIRPGQQVSEGDRLLVIEAMKMDNVLRASRGGVVETIHTAEGHHVAHGEILLEYRT
jgi:biotin carboxyl carrier protein